jgi:hypothetical protein
MIQVLKCIANTSVNTFPLPIMSIRPLLEEIWTGNAKWTYQGGKGLIKGYIFVVMYE